MKEPNALIYLFLDALFPEEQIKKAEEKKQTIEETTEKVEQSTKQEQTCSYDFTRDTSLSSSTFLPFDETTTDTTNTSKREKKRRLYYNRQFVHPEHQHLYLLFGLWAGPTYQMTSVFRLPIKHHHNHLESWRTNMFVPSVMKLDLYESYFRIRSMHRCFVKIARLYRWRRAPVQVQTDLYMNDLDVRHPHTIGLMQQGHIYYFTLPNLVHLIQEALLHGSYFFVEPKPFRNPFNNCLFTKADLFNIYFRVREQFVKVPEALHLFFCCEFDVCVMLHRHHTRLTQWAIRRYTQETPHAYLEQDIRSMLHQYGQRFSRQQQQNNNNNNNHNQNENNILQIHELFDQNTLIEQMRPYLELYFRSKFSACVQDREISGKELQRRLFYIFTMYGKYGQPIYKNGYVKKRPSINNDGNDGNNGDNDDSDDDDDLEEEAEHITGFETGLPRFHEHYLPAFLTSHQYNEQIYNRYLRDGHTASTFLFSSTTTTATATSTTVMPSSSSSSSVPQQQQQTLPLFTQLPTRRRVRARRITPVRTRAQPFVLSLGVGDVIIPAESEGQPPQQQEEELEENQNSSSSSSSDNEE